MVERHRSYDQSTTHPNHYLRTEAPIRVFCGVLCIACPTSCTAAIRVVPPFDSVELACAGRAVYREVIDIQGAQLAYATRWALIRDCVFCRLATSDNFGTRLAIQLRVIRAGHLQPLESATRWIRSALNAPSGRASRYPYYAEF